MTKEDEARLAERRDQFEINGCDEEDATFLLHILDEQVARIAALEKEGRWMCPEHPCHCADFWDEKETAIAARAGEAIAGSPCAKCGAARTIAEGGKTFAVCDGCWDAVAPGEVKP